MDLSRVPVSSKHRCPDCTGVVKELSGVLHKGADGYWCDECRVAGYVRTIQGVSYSVPA
jgi:hypothetical protein